MKRNMELVLAILSAIEADEMATGGGSVVSLDLPGYSREEVLYHVRLLRDAELIEIEESEKAENDLKWKSLRLTWKGHEFLSLSGRDGDLWNRVKKQAWETGTSSFEILKNKLIELAMRIFLNI